MKDIDTIVDNFINDLELDQLTHLANLLDISWEYPPVDDMYPDWQAELETEILDELCKVLEGGK